ncbi:MAG: type II toxin-antitoxin system HicA family toxin [Dehalococcoidia bacterium]|nr:type II toxin-antitoxin system HicA family toxin [Dehalococcoidia bacterium]
MPRLKRLSGAEVVSVLRQFGFEVVSTRGSHVKLRRVSADGTPEALVVPLHRQLDTGLTHAIYRQATRYVPEAVLRPFFYSD